MHTGRVGHPLNLPAGGRVIGPSAVAAPGQMWTDAQQMQAHPVPVEATEADIATMIEEFASAAELAVNVAGFDGDELHGANGYLIEQFLNTASNHRTDAWGGSVENRIRFAVEVAKATVARIGGARVGIRLSPYGVSCGMQPDATTDETYIKLVKELDAIGLAYIHLVDHSALGAPPVPQSLKDALRAAFSRTVILAGGFSAATAEADLAAGRADLIAFGRPFISNPALVTKLRTVAELRAPDFGTFYTPGPEGYLDYPTDV